MFKECYTDKQGNPKSEGVAAAIADMDDKTSRLSPNKRDTLGPNDIFAQVVGEERNGRVRMVGGGVAPTDLWSHVPSQKTSYRLSMERQSALEDLQVKYKKQEDRIAHLEAMLNQQISNGLQHNSGVGSTTSAARSSLPVTESLRIDGKVSLRRMRDPSKIVATGYLRSLNPDDILNGHILGEGWCEVHGQTANEPDEVLIRPFDMFDRILDVLGCSISCPTHLVVPEEFDME